MTDTAKMAPMLTECYGMESSFSPRSNDAQSVKEAIRLFRSDLQDMKTARQDDVGAYQSRADFNRLGRLCGEAMDLARYHVLDARNSKREPDADILAFYQSLDGLWDSMLDLAIRKSQ